MAEEQELFRTDDTSLATFISLYVEPVKHGWEETACFWYFPDSEKLASLVRDYTGNTALVNPRKYSAIFSIRKQEMYQARKEFNEARAS